MEGKMKISVQTGGLIDELGIEKCYKTIAEAGFEAIDWNLDHSLRPALINAGDCEGNCIFEKDMEEILDFYAEELTHIRKNGLKITQAHAPFPAYVIDKPWVLDYMIKIYKQMILFCDRVGCKNLVIHNFTAPRNSEYDLADEAMAINDKLYTSLIPELLETNVTVCLENLFGGGGATTFAGIGSEPEEAAKIIDRYNALAGKECFGYCLDTGHMNRLRHDPRRVIPILGSRIKALHIHDNAGEIDQHKAPYTGTVNWKAFYTALKMIDYKGDLSFETFNQVRLGKDAEELVEPWLRLIYLIGDHFRKKILD